MTAEAEVERTMARWLADEASTAGRDRVLVGALARVARSDQERFLTQRLLGDRLGRVSAVRRALAVGLAAGLLAGAAALAGALLREPPPVPPASRVNGAISYAAGGDLYLVEPGIAPHRIVGADGDGSDAGCQAFSMDGSRLAYVEARSPWDTAATWSIVVSAVDAHGGLLGGPSRVQMTGSLTACPAWSSNLQRLVYVRPAFEGGDLVVVELARGGAPVVRVPGPGTGSAPPASDFSLGPLAWSPDGERLAYVRSSGPDLQQSEIRVIGISTGGAPMLVAPAEAGTLVNTLAWSPDGRSVAAGSSAVPGDASAIRIMAVSPPLLPPTTIEGASGPAWSPDGMRIAYTFAGGLVVQSIDGGSRVTLPAIGLDRQVTPGTPSWSPDGEWLLMDASDAPFVDRGVSHTVLAVDPDGLRPPIVLAPWRLGSHRDLTWQGIPR